MRSGGARGYSAVQSGYSPVQKWKPWNYVLPRAVMTRLRRVASEHVVPAIRARDSAIDLERIPLHPVVAQEAIRAHFPDRCPAHFEGRAIRLGSHEAVVAPGHAPARGHAAAVLVLEGLDNMEFEIADLCLEILHPLNGSRPTMSRPPEVMTKSLCARRSMASGFCGCVHTSRQKFSTIATLSWGMTPPITPPFKE